MQTELHRHLDASLRIETLFSLAQERGLEAQSTRLESFRDQFILSQPLPDLSSVLAKFVLFQKVLDRPEVLERVAYETLEDCWNEGTRKVELRYSPYFVSEFSGITWEDALSAFERGLRRGLKQYPGMQTGLICIAPRDSGIDVADATVEFFLKHQARFIGLDLAGSEKQFPCRLFQSSFKKAIAAGAQITVHAGEATGPETIWEAIELLGAKRIGHGVASVSDPGLKQYLIKNQICLEMCPTSNWITSAVPSLKEHPLPKLLREGVPVTISTDDPGIFGASLTHEIQVCRKILDMTEAEIALCQETASKASFINTV